MVVHLYFSSASLKKTALDSLLQIQITDIRHLSSVKTRLVLLGTGQIRSKFCFAGDAVHLYHFTGPFVDEAFTSDKILKLSE